MFIWFDSLRHSQDFPVMSGRVFQGRTSSKQKIKCLAQGTIKYINMNLNSTVSNGWNIPFEHWQVLHRSLIGSVF